MDQVTFEQVTLGGITYFLFNCPTSKYLISMDKGFINASLITSQSDQLLSEWMLLDTTKYMFEYLKRLLGYNPSIYVDHPEESKGLYLHYLLLNNYLLWASSNLSDQAFGIFKTYLIHTHTCLPELDGELNLGSSCLKGSDFDDGITSSLKELDSSIRYLIGKGAQARQLTKGFNSLNKRLTMLLEETKQVKRALLRNNESLTTRYKKGEREAFNLMVHIKSVIRHLKSVFYISTFCLILCLLSIALTY